MCKRPFLKSLLARNVTNKIPLRTGAIIETWKVTCKEIRLHVKDYLLQYLSFCFIIKLWINNFTLNILFISLLCPFQNWIVSVCTIVTNSNKEDVSEFQQTQITSVLTSRFLKLGTILFNFWEYTYYFV